MTRPKRQILAALLVAAGGPAALAAEGEARLASNEQVLDAWQAGGGQAASVVQEPEGGSRIEWHGGLSAERYVNHASGGNTLTPQRSGAYSRYQMQSDLRRTDEEGDITYWQMALTHSSDPSVLSHPNQIDMLQVGRVGPGYQIAAGDIALSHSTLGTSTGLRGLLGYRQFDSVTLSGGAGVIAESWATLNNKQWRQQYLRNAYAAKLELPVTTALRAYFTTQGYGDEKGSVDNNASLLSPASGRAHTLGFAYQEGRVNLQGEAGTSRWSEDGQDSRNDRAMIVDGGWNGDKVSLRAGHHKIGKYYTSLAAQAGNGVEETYANASWSAASWLSLSGDLRRSKNDLALNLQQTTPPIPSTPNSTRTDSATVNAAINFGPNWQGLALNLTQSVSRGENSDKSSNRNSQSGTSLTYANALWNGGLSYYLGQVTNDAAGGSNSETSTWVVHGGRNLNNAVGGITPTWNLNLSAVAMFQEQKLDAGGSTRNDNYTLSLTGQRERWGSLAAALIYGTTSQPGGGPDLVRRGYVIDATHAFNRIGSVKLYARNNRNSGGSGQEYKENTLGLQLVLMY